MSLPIAWVDKIFHKLTVTYGREFLSRYEGIPMVDVKTEWSCELAGFASNGSAIGYALEHLPADRAPTVIGFKALCVMAPEPETPRLPAPAANPQRMREELAKLAPVLSKPGSYDFKDWARTHLAEHSAGIPKTPAQLAMSRRAIGLEA